MSTQVGKVRDVTHVTPEWRKSPWEVTKANTSQSIFAWNHLGLFPSHSCSCSLPSHWSRCKFMVRMITPDFLHLTPKGTRHLCRCFCLKHSSSPRGVKINLHLPPCLSFPLCIVNQSFAMLLISMTSVPAQCRRWLWRCASDFPLYASSLETTIILLLIKIYSSGKKRTWLLLPILQNTHWLNRLNTPWNHHSQQPQDAAFSGHPPKIIHSFLFRWWPPMPPDQCSLCWALPTCTCQVSWASHCSSLADRSQKYLEIFIGICWKFGAVHV